MENKQIKPTQFLLFVCIVLAAFAIRFYQIGKAPSGILIDEASFGYNAYSILKTGKDEHGVTLPLIFKAFGDQKLPAYAYSIVPCIKALGLNNLAVRLPSVLAGSILSGVFFLLLLEIGFTLPVSFVGGLIVAMSPWSILLSRFAFESNFGLLFFITGVFLSLRAIRKNSIPIALLAGISFGITLYSYVSFKLIVPLMIIVFIAFHYKKTIEKKVLLGIVIAFIISIAPILISLFSTQTTARFNQIGITFNTGLKMEIDEDRAFCGTKLPHFVCYAASNKPLFYARTYIHRYISALSPSYLFLDGDVEYTYLNVDHFGAFYVWLIPFYFIGLAYLWKKIVTRSLSPFETFLLLGLLVAPLPTLLVSGPQKVRISALFPFITLVIVYGIAQAETIIKKVWQKKVLYISLVLLCLLSILYFLVHYLTIHIYKYESSYGTYIPKLMKYLGEQDKGAQIYIRSITEGITFYAYENAVDPKIYQHTVQYNKPDVIGFAHAINLQNIHITDKDLYGVACEAKSKNVSALFVSNENYKEISNASKKIIFSENGVDTLAIIYDVSKIQYDYALCP